MFSLKIQNFNVPYLTLQVLCKHTLLKIVFGVDIDQLASNEAYSIFINIVIPQFNTDIPRNQKLIQSKQHIEIIIVQSLYNAYV